MSWYGKDWRISEAVAGSNVAISIPFKKKKNSNQLASSHRHTVSPKITQKGLSYSERDTCKTLSRDDHTAAAAAALVEALTGQVGI